MTNLTKLPFSCEACHERLCVVDSGGGEFTVRPIHVNQCHRATESPRVCCVSLAYAIADALERFPGGAERRTPAAQSTV